MNWRSWQTWAMLVAIVVVAALNWIFPNAQLSAPENMTWATLIIWIAISATKILGILAAGGIGIGIVRREYAMRMATLPKVRSLPRAGDTSSQISDLMNQIYADLDDSQIPYKKVDGNGQVTIDPVPVAPRISRALSNCWNSADYSMSFKLELLKTALSICSASFTKVAKLPLPTKWDDCADFDAYWRKNETSCAVNSEALFFQVLMPLRTVLKIQDTGDI